MNLLNLTTRLNVVVFNTVNVIIWPLPFRNESKRSPGTKKYDMKNGQLAGDSRHDTLEQV